MVNSKGLVQRCIRIYAIAEFGEGELGGGQFGGAEFEEGAVWQREGFGGAVQSTACTACPVSEL